MIYVIHFFCGSQTLKPARVCVSLFCYFDFPKKATKPRHCRRESETTEKPISERPQPLPQPHVVGVAALPQSLPSYWTNQDGRSKHKTCTGYQSYSYVYCIWYTYIYIYIFVYLYIYIQYLYFYIFIYSYRFCHFSRFPEDLRDGHFRQRCDVSAEWRELFQVGPLCRVYI